jgi:hypothetical protein
MAAAHSDRTEPIVKKQEATLEGKEEQVEKRRIVETGIKVGGT